MKDEVDGMERIVARCLSLYIRMVETKMALTTRLRAYMVDTPSHDRRLLFEAGKGYAFVCMGYVHL